MRIIALFLSFCSHEPQHLSSVAFAPKKENERKVLESEPIPAACSRQTEAGTSPAAAARPGVKVVFPAKHPFLM